MFDLIMDFIEKIINSALTAFNLSVLSSARTVFKVEDEISMIISLDGINEIKDYFFLLGFLLLGIKFFIKGFRAYIAYTEGDAQASPSFLLTRYIKASIIMLCFTEAYDIFADVCLEIIADVMDIISNKMAISIGSDAGRLIGTALLNVYSGGGVMLIVVLIYLILYIIIMIRYMRAGLEMLLLRIGIVFACLGILDTEEEVFKTYMKKFANIFFTTLITLVLLSFSLGCIISSHPLWAIVLISTALNTPKFLQEFMLIVRGEGNAMTKAYYSSNMVRSVVKMFRRGA